MDQTMHSPTDDVTVFSDRQRISCLQQILHLFDAVSHGGQLLFRVSCDLRTQITLHRVRHRERESLVRLFVVARVPLIQEAGQARHVGHSFRVQRVPSLQHFFRSTHFANELPRNLETGIDERSTDDIGHGLWTRR